MTQPTPTPTKTSPQPEPTFILCARWKGWCDNAHEELLVGDSGHKRLFIETSQEPPRLIRIGEAFNWWLRCKLLHEKTGEFRESEEIEELHIQVADVLFKTEGAYWKAESIRMKNAAKNLDRKLESILKGGAR